MRDKKHFLNVGARPQARALAQALARARRGSVIVVVLVTLLLASMMLMKFMESSAVELTLATRQADRDRLRTHLLDLFEVVGPEDPAVSRARIDLANALF